MVVKKAGKSVLDYDPLQWLKDDETADDDEQQPDEPVEQQSSHSEEAGNSIAAEAEKPGEKTVTEVAETVVSSELENSAVETVEPEPVIAESTDNDYLVLDTELTMKNVAEVKQHLDEIMKADTPVSIDADALRKIDSAGLQMLYSLQKTLKKNGASISWKAESDVIKTAAGIIEMDFDSVPDQKSIAEIEAEQGFGFF